MNNQWHVAQDSNGPMREMGDMMGVGFRNPEGRSIRYMGEPVPEHANNAGMARETGFPLTL